MEPTTWTVTEDILHHVAIIITASAAVIAAVSSLKNGRTLNGKVDPKLEDVHQAVAKPTKKKTVKGAGIDWYHPPDLKD